MIKKLDILTPIQKLAGGQLKKTAADRYFRQVLTGIKNNPKAAFETLGKILEPITSDKFETLSKNIKKVPFYKARALAAGAIVTTKLKAGQTKEQITALTVHLYTKYPAFMTFVEQLWKQ